ncbi:hypothetical protein K5F27_16965 [Acinetobacter baumannii]|uniref:hypothetical protein n=2 Tax=Acinetobacter baumannii TaxID=470 RepID=UPI001FF31E88|nr:hypothetical protein [Acinetobacter baumannii]MCJ9181399.1 hypothetical protein [Acinetobacter baumannii]MCJ9185110.1 hypothetical protein [Acinetobacter baumannii]MCJ9192349.1 hypothetical protein [Acinetobacter baumannii]MCJ9199712.1 hypothetical protein [Acinetobacter baumannii]MCJ9251397.1 hypothetical protein [Acinetobacter baumannii]
MDGLIRNPFMEKEENVALATQAKVIRQGNFGITGNPKTQQISQAVQSLKDFDAYLIDDHKRAEKERQYSTSTNDLKRANFSDRLPALARLGASTAWATVKHGVAQNMGGLSADLAGQARLDMPQEVFDAYNRFVAHQQGEGELQPNDMKLLNSAAYRQPEVFGFKGIKEQIDGKSFLSHLQYADSLDKEAQRRVGDPRNNIPDAFDSQKHVNPYFQEQRAYALAKQREKIGLPETRAKADELEHSGYPNSARLLRGIANVQQLLNDSKVAIQHPTALAQDFAGILPYVATGTVGAVGGAALQAGEDHINSKKQFTERTGKAIPSQAESMGMGAMAGVNFLANFAENAMLGKVVKGGGIGHRNVGTGKIANAVAEGSKDLVRAYAANAIAGYTQAKIQTGAGSLNFTHDNDQEAIEAAALGGVLAGGAVTPHTAVSRGIEVGKGAAEVVNKKAQERRAIQEATFEDNINPAHESYNPAEAINKQTEVFANKQATEEDLNIARAKAQDAVKVAQEHFKEVSAERDVMVTRLEQIETLKNDIIETRELAAKDPENTALQDTVVSMESWVKELEERINPEYQKAVTESYARATKARDEALSSFDAFNGLNEVKTGTKQSADLVEQNTEILQKPEAPEPVKLQATEHLVNYPMMYKPETVRSIADDLSNHLTDAQRTTLRELSDLRVKEHMTKKIHDVSADLTKGSANYKSLDSYFTDFSHAARLNDTTRMEQLSDQFDRLHTSYEAKAALADKLFAHAQKTGGTYQVVRTEAKQWKINQGKLLSEAAIKKNGGFTIHRGSEKLVNSIKSDWANVNEAFQVYQRVTSPEFRSVGTDGIGLGRTPINEPTFNMDPAPEQTPGAPRVDEVAPGVLPKDGTAEPHAIVNTDDVKAPVGEVNVRESEADLKPSIEAEPVAAKPKGEAVVHNLKGATPEVQKAERSKSFESRDLVKANLTQKVSAESRSPLVDTPNFRSEYSKAKDKREFVQSHLNKPMTDTQHAQVQHFVEYTKIFDKVVDQIFTPKAGDKEKYRYQDLVQFLAGADGKLEENTRTALAVGAYQWIAENGSAYKLTDSEIARLLHLPADGDFVIPSQVRKMFDHVGTPYRTVIQSIGQKAVQALQLKTVKDADPNYLGKMEASMGALALHALVDLGYVKETAIKSADFQRAQAQVSGKPETKVENELETHIFIAPNHTEKNGSVVKNPHVEQILDHAKNTQGVLSSLFSTDSGLIAPATTKPEKFTQTTIKNSKTEIPEATRKALEKSQQNPYRIRPEVAQLYQGLYKHAPNALKRILDIDDSKANLEKYHVTQRENLQAKFANEWTSLERGLEFVNSLESKDGEYQHIYFEPVVWSNQRVGFKSNMFNIQTSQIHRSLAGMVDHESKFKKGMAALEDGKATPYGMFLRAIAAGAEEIKGKLAFPEGYKGGKTVDKAPSEVFLPALQTYLNSEPVRKSIAAMQRVQDAIAADKAPEISDVKLVAKQVEEFGMGPHSALVLSELARYANTKDGEEFTTHLGMESDGVTNGPAISNVLSGTLTPDLALQFGLIPKAGEGQEQHIKNYFDVKTSGMDDYYEGIGRLQKEFIDELNATTFKGATNVTRALDTLAGKFGTRSSAKKIATPFNYSAGFPALKAAIAREMVKDMYTEFAKIAQDAKSGDPIKAESAQLKANTMIDAVNTAIRYYNSQSPKKVSEIRTKVGNANGLVEAARMADYVLTADQVKALTKVSELTHGLASERAIRKAADSYIKTRDLNIKMHNAAYGLYKITHDALVRQAENAGAKDGSIASSKVKSQKGNEYVLLEGLPRKTLDNIQNTLKPYAPVIVSAMGNKSSNRVESGLFLSDTTNQFSRDSKNQVKSLVSPKNGKTKTKTYNTGVLEQVETNPGVRGSAMYVQGSDSYISVGAVSKMPAINVHDANIVGIDQVAQLGKIQNQEFFDLAVGYRSQVENFMALVRPLQGLVALKDKVQLTKDEWAQVRGVFNTLRTSLTESGLVDEKTANAMDAGQILAKLSDAKFQNELNKIEFMQNIYSVHQYGAEGGEVVLTDAHRKQLEAEHKALQADGAKLREDMLKLADKLRDAMNNTSSRKDVADTIKDKSADGSADFEQLVSIKDNRTKLQKGLDEYVGKEVPLAKVVDLLRAELKGGNEVHGLLFNVLEKILPKDLKVEYSADSWRGQQGAAGWYNPKSNKVVIRALGDKDAAVIPELFLHEFVHAALVGITTDAAKYPEVTAAVERIESLREQVSKQLPDDFSEALKNKEEFMAWGLTNPEFQDALKGIIVPKGERNRKGFASAFKVFVTNVMKALFSKETRKPNAKEISALEALIIDSADVMNYANQVGSVKPENLELPFNMVPNTNDILDRMRTAKASELLDAFDGSHLSGEFNSHLQNVMTNSVDRLLDSIGREHLTDTLAKPVDYKPHDVSALYGLSDREGFVAEVVATVVDSIQESGAHTPVMKQMQQAYQDARQKLTVEDFHDGDWSLASPSEKALAERKYERVFTPKSAGEKSSYLSTFMALAVGSENFSSKLKFTTERQQKGQRSLFEKAVDLFNYVVDWATNRLAGTSPTDTVDAKAAHLLNRLVSLDINKRQQAVSRFDRAWDATIDAVSKTNQLGTKAVVKAINKTNIANSKYSALRTLGKLASVAARDSVDELPKLMKEFRDQSNPNKRFGEVAELVNEMTSPSEFKQAMETMLRETVAIQANRKNWIDNTKRMVMRGFTDNGANLTKAQHKAVTYSLLRTDVSSLLDGRDFKQVSKLVTDAQARDYEMRKLTREIEKLEPDLGNDMINRVKELGWYMVGNSSAGLAKNAISIAAGFGTHYAKAAIPEANSPLVKAIDQLASLYALEYTHPDHLAETAKLMKSEGEGIEGIIKMHKFAVDDSKKMFADNITSMVKGYLPEITHTYREVKQAPLKDAQDLVKAGWVQVGRLDRDPIDTHGQDQALFVLKDGGEQRIVSGAMTFDSTHRKGSVVTDGRSGSITAEYKKSLKDLAQVRAKIPHSKYDPRKAKGTRMVPAYDTKGTIIDFAYEMTHASRDELLVRNNNFADLLGAYVGNNVGREPTVKQNKSIANAMYEDYVDNYAKNPRSYVAIGPNVSDPHLSEVWRLMPFEVKQEVENLWGKDNPMMVRNDIVNMAFGFKKLSINEAFERASGQRNFMENFFVSTLQAIFGDKAQLKAVRTERAFQEIMKFAKDAIVIRTMSVLWGNIKANALLHLAYGVNPVHIARDTSVALRAGLSYRKQRALLIQAEIALRTDTKDRANWEHQLVTAQDAIARNPLREFIEAGMMPSIVEDVALNEANYSYKTELGEKFETQLNKVPKSVRTAGKWMMISPDTPLYKLLAGATQYSDFTSKYVLYKHLTSKKADPMSHADALQEASDAFINYDIPTTRRMQYMNDMGLFMFTKFLLRFQRVLFTLMKRQPALVLAQNYATEWLTNTPGVLDPMLLNRLGNPFRSSILQAPDAVTDIATFKALF